MDVRAYKPLNTSTALVAPDIAPLPVTPTGDEIFSAAFDRENDVVNAWNYLSRPQFPAEPGFDVVAKTKDTPYWEDYRDVFVGTQSNAEWDFIAAKIKQEEADAAILAAGGWAGTLAAIGAGILSPTMLLPGIVPIRGIKGAMVAGSLGMAANAIQELPLQANQVTRTAEESAFAVAIGAVAGVALHGAVSMMTRAEARQLQYRIDNAPRETSIHSPFTSPAQLIDIATTVARTANIPPMALDNLRQAHIAAEPLRAAIRAELGDVISVAPVRAADNTAVFVPTTDASYVKLPVNEIIAISDAGEIITRNDDAFVYKLGPDGKLADAEMLSVRKTIPTAAPAATKETLDNLEDVAKAAAAGAQANELLGRAGTLKGGRVVKAIAALSPVGSTIAQTTFPKLSAGMAALSTGGMKLAGNARGLVSAVGGTVETRVRLYDKHIATLVETVDEHYADYWKRGIVAPPAVTKHAGFNSSFVFDGKKLTRKEFNTEVSRALLEGDLHPISQVQATAQTIRQEILNPILSEAEGVQLFKAAEDLNGDVSYLMRQYDTEVISGRLPEFVQILANHYEKSLRDEFVTKASGLKARQALVKEFTDDMLADQATVTARREAFAQQLKELPETAGEAQIKKLRRDIRAAKTNKTPAATVDQWRKDIKDLQTTEGPTLQQRSFLKRRLRQLDRSYFGLEKKRAETMHRMDQLEGNALDSLVSVMNVGKKLAKDIDSLSPKQIEKQIEDLRTRYINAYHSVRNMRIKFFKMQGSKGIADEYDMVKTQLAVKESDFNMKFADAFENMDYIKELGNNREVLADLLKALAKESNAAVNKLNLRRGERIGTLRGKLKKYDPEIAKAKVAAKVDALKEREISFNERMRTLGIDDFDLENETAVISGIAKERAENTASRILRFNNRIAGLHIIGEERGAELARVLTIPTREIFDFIVTDVERSVRNYVRQVSADIEIKRTFGDVNAKTFFEEADAEYHAAVKAATADGADEKALKKLGKQYQTHLNHITAALSRLRHTWGVPDNPHGFAARAAKVMLDLNTLRFMGSVLVSSLSDPARPVMKYGISRTFKSGLLPLISDFKNFKISARELKLAGGALDPIIHSRAMAFSDTFDEALGETAPERLLHTAASKIGKIALFDYWTSGLKQFSGAIQVAEIMDSIDSVVNGASKADVAKATEYLASINIDSHSAMRIWDEVQNGGGGKVNGIWLPNTEDWTSPELVRTFRAALRGENDATIITPGLEVPGFTNSTLAGRLLWQFKSYTFASHTKLLVAGLQDKDARVLSGLLFSTALGMLSYVVAAKAVGGRMEEEMMNAPFEKFLDEGISRAGFAGDFSLLHQLMQAIPGISPYTSLSGRKVTRRSGAGLTGSLLGPSYDTLQTGAQLASGIDDPTKSTVAQGFDLIPLNNVFYLRWLFKRVEDAVAEDLPVKRSAR